LRVRQAPASFDVKLKISKLSIYDLFSLLAENVGRITNGQVYNNLELWLQYYNWAQIDRTKCPNSICTENLLADLHIAGAALLIVMRTVLSHRLADWQGS
jgi:hypothetical protein